MRTKEDIEWDALLVDYENLNWYGKLYARKRMNEIRHIIKMKTNTYTTKDGYVVFEYESPKCLKCERKLSVRSINNNRVVFYPCCKGE